MNRFQLYFDGIAWPAAKVSDHCRSIEFLDDSAAWTNRAFTYAIISTTGGGRAWHTVSALAWWRTFAEMDLYDGEAIAGFVQRYGDPASELGPGKPVHTKQWETLQMILMSLAGAWTQQADNSEIMPEDSDRFKRATTSLEMKVPLFMQEENIQKILDRNGFGFRFRLLGDFMIASAADMFFRKAKMRKCDVCGHWFEYARSSARVCSAACHARKAKEGAHDGARQQA